MQGGLGDRGQQFSQTREVVVGLGRVEPIKITLVHFCGIHALDLGQDDLQRSVVDLGAAGAVDVVPAVERVEGGFVRVPHHSDDRAGSVGQLQQDVLATLTIDSQLFVSSLERLGQRHSVGEIMDSGS